MSEPFVGQLILVGFNFAPRAFAQCNGQILSISQNTALFALLGTFYGGNGTSTFALPDLRSRVPIGEGNGLGLSSYVIGEVSGVENVTLLQTELPAHSHTYRGDGAPGGTSDPSNNSNARLAGGSPYTTAAALVTMSPNAITPSGSSLPHNNIAPYLALNWLIALQGVFPSRN